MTKLLPLLLVCAGVLFAQDKPSPPFGRIERLDPAFDKLVAANATIEKIADGFTWAEGPLWFDGALIASDPKANVINRWKPGATSLEVFIKPSGQLTPVAGFREPGSNGLALDRQGRLLVAQHGERRIARYENGKFTAVADRFDGKRFSSPNDLAVKKNGDVYFTDPPYGLEGMDQSPLKELDFHGVFRVTPDGKVTALTKTIRFPNGIAFSPDEKILYIGSTDSKTPHIAAFDVQSDGTIANERMFFDAVPVMKDGTRGGCDGMKVDRDGNVWTSGPDGILIVSPAGKLLGRLHTGVPTSNCNWGDDGSTLYITANTFLLRLKTTTKGAVL